MKLKNIREKEIENHNYSFFYFTSHIQQSPSSNFNTIITMISKKMGKRVCGFLLLQLSYVYIISTYRAHLLLFNTRLILVLGVTNYLMLITRIISMPSVMLVSWAYYRVKSKKRLRGMQFPEFLHINKNWYPFYLKVCWIKNSWFTPLALSILNKFFHSYLA